MRRRTRFSQQFKERIVELTADVDVETRLIDALRDRKRCGGAAKRRKIGCNDAHAVFVRELLEKHDARLQLSELCTLFERQFDVRVSRSTMHRFVHEQLGFSRQRVQRQLPRQALTEKNIKWRKEFVDEWFVGADGQLVGTNDEQNDQQSRESRATSAFKNEQKSSRLVPRFSFDPTNTFRATMPPAAPTAINTE